MRIKAGKTFKDRFGRFFRLIYLKLFRINDSPQRIALGFGLGVFLGILPGAGPIASLALAVMLRVNRVSALIGCLLTNTWLSVVAFLMAIKIGAVVFNVRWQDIQDQFLQLKNNFHFSDLMQMSVLKILLPVFVGYVVAGAAAGLVGYGLCLYAFSRRSLKKGR